MRVPDDGPAARAQRLPLTHDHEYRPLDRRIASRAPTVGFFFGEVFEATARSAHRSPLTPYEPPSAAAPLVRENIREAANLKLYLRTQVGVAPFAKVKQPLASDLPVQRLV